MKAYLDTVIPARFLCTLAHLIASILVIYGRSDIILASLPLTYSASEYNTIESSILAAVWLSIIFLLVELVGMFSGLSLFAPLICGYDTASHFTATILISWMIKEAWHYYSMWYIWVFFSLIPLALEVISFMRFCCVKTLKY